MNNVVLLGRLTRDVELRSTQNGNVVANFSIAVNRNFKNANGEYEADFINCVAWRNTAEFISKYFKKGDMISARGRIQTRKYEDPDGTMHYVTEVVIEEVGFVGGKNRESAEPIEDVPEIPDEDDLPF